MSIHYYPHHLGDYAKATPGLSMIEHGAYRLLIDFYYSNGGPFPNDLKVIHRICRAHTPTERRAVTKVLSKFFSPADGVWYHPRCDKELEILRERSEIARGKAKKRHAVAPAAALLANSHKPIANNHKLAKLNGSREENGFQEEFCDSNFIPSGWQELAEAKGLSQDQLFASWRRFYEKTGFPVSLSRWVGWLERERVN